MAKMIPEELSEGILNDPKKRAEVKVYRILRQRLGNDWTVFYSISWLGKAYQNNIKPRDGEIDFIVANPKHGILIIEVKGGNPIEFDGINGKWYTNNKEGKFEIKDPYNQGRDNKFALINYIREWQGWGNGLGGVPLYNAALFPDVSRIEGRLPLHAKEEITITEDDFGSINKKIISALEFNMGQLVIDTLRTRNLIGDLTRNIAPRTLIKRRLVNSIEEEEEEIIRLTEQQHAILRAMHQVPRLSVSGCVGSGKTLLAKQKAKMSNSVGQRTLLCCYSTLLGEDFRQFATENPGLSGNNLHSIMYSILKNSGDYLHQDIISIINDDNRLDAALLECKYAHGFYDTIVIDEAQDFSNTQLEIIDLLLMPGGSLYCFWDDNQKVLRHDFKLPSDMVPYNLDTNFRNTNKIFNHLKPFYTANKQIFNCGPEGRSVKIAQPYNPDKSHDLKQKLKNELMDLKENEGINTSQITVLTFKSKEKSQLTDFEIPGIPISNFENIVNRPSVRIETIRRFKGLESQVVILTEMDESIINNNEDLWNNLCYVGISRARNHLIILPPANMVDIFNVLQIK